MQGKKTGTAGIVGFCLSLLLAFGLTAQAAAQDYPSKPVKILVGFPAGTSPDLIARELGSSLSARWAQPVVIVNRPGAAGVVAAEAASREAPDGLTLFVTSASALVSPRFLQKDLRYDPLAVTAIAGVARSEVVLISKTFAKFNELLAAAKSKPREVTYGIYGLGSTSHIAMEKLKRATGVDLLQVSYGSTGPIPDVLAGNVDALWSGLQVVGLIESGKVNGLAYSGLKRAPSLPNVPTVSEMGYPDFEYVLWFGLFGPPGVPSAIVKKIATDTEAVARTAAFERRVADLRMEAAFLDSRRFTEHIRREYADYKALFE